MYTQHKWFVCVSFSNIMDPDIWCCSHCGNGVHQAQGQEGMKELLRNENIISLTVKPGQAYNPHEDSLMNNYKYNNNNNNNNKLYLSVRYFSYEALGNLWNKKIYMYSNKIKYLQLKRKNKWINK